MTVRICSYTPMGALKNTCILPRPQLADQAKFGQPDMPWMFVKPAHTKWSQVSSLHTSLLSFIVCSHDTAISHGIKAKSDPPHAIGIMCVIM